MESLPHKEEVRLRPLAIPELRDRFLACRNNDPFIPPLGKGDQNNIKKTFFLFEEYCSGVDISLVNDISLIDDDTVRKFLIHIVQNVKNKYGEQYARSYINEKILKYLKQSFSWGAAQRPRLISALQDFQIAKVKPVPKSSLIRENEPRKNVTFEPVKAALELIDAEYPTYGDAMRIQFLNGMRPGEALGIKSCYIDYEYDAENWHFQPGKHKTAGKGKSRDFIFGKLSRQILEKYKPEDSYKCFFLNSRGNPITVDLYDKKIRQLIEKHGLKKFVPYQLRHAIATLVDQNIDIEHAQLYLGHADPKMTKQYLHEQLAKIRKVSIFLDSALAETLLVSESTSPTPPSPEPANDFPHIIPIHEYRKA